MVATSRLALCKKRLDGDSQKNSQFLRARAEAMAPSLLAVAMHGRANRAAATPRLHDGRVIGERSMQRVRVCMPQAVHEK